MARVSFHPKLEWRSAPSGTIRGGIHRVDDRARGSLGLLAVLATMTGTAFPLLLTLLPAAQVLPAFSLTFLAAAAAAALLACSTKAGPATRGFTLWDLVGGLAFLGFAAGMLSEPAHVIELFGLAAASQ